MKENQITEGNILGSLLRFAVPVLAALFLQAMYGAVDLLIVGKYAQIADQSGVATGSMFTTSFGNVITCFAIGVTVFIGEAIGSGHYERAGKGIGTGIAMFSVMAVLASIILVVLAEKIALLMHAPSGALEQTTNYIRICGGGIVFIIAYNVIGAVFRGIGDSKTPLITVMIACAVNIVCDLVLIIVFHMGAEGAAFATVLAQAVSVLISLFIIRRKDLPFTLKKADLRPDPIYMRKIIIIGTPVALQELLVGLSFIFVQSTVNAIGMVESAAIGVGEKVCAFLMLAASSYMQSMAAFVAQNNGAGKRDRSKKALKYGIQTALLAGLVTGSLAFFGGNLLAGIFSNKQAVITAAHSYLRAFSIDCILTAVLFCFIGYFNGCEKTMFVMVQGIIGAFGIRVPAVILFSRIGNGSLFLIGLATPLSSIVQIILCAAAFVHYERKYVRNSFKSCAYESRQKQTSD